MKNLVPIALALSGALALSTTGSVGPRESAALLAEKAEILRHMSLVYLDDGQGGLAKTIRFTAVNVQVVNGLGATNGFPANPDSTYAPETETNGLGNLVVGYNELGNPLGDDRTGSHFLVVGHGNSYHGYGGLVAAQDNTARGAYPTVTGGWQNLSEGARSSVAGGSLNVATGNTTAVAGGTSNVASASNAAVGGGASNAASGPSAFVAGGAHNEAPGDRACALGGIFNLATGTQSAVTGGESNTATGFRSAVSGGLGRVAPGAHDWVAGGLFEDD